MAQSDNDFAQLLTKAIRRISTEADQSITTTQDQISYMLGKKKGGSLIEFWRRGKVPSELKDLEQLTRELVKRGGLRNQAEVAKFLAYGGHPNPAPLTNELIPQSIETTSTVLYKRLTLDTKRIISSTGLVTSFYQTEIQALAEFPLQSIRHRRMANEGKLEDLVLEFTPGYRDGHGGMRRRILSKSEKLLVWAVEFDPGLLKNQKASYSYVQSCRGSHAITYEQCNEQFVAGHSQGKYDYWRFKMTAPTDELHMKLEFSPNYPIALPPSDGFSVFSDSSEHLYEKARLMNGHCFSKKFNEETQQWTLELKVKSALMGLGYQLQWIPPRSTVFIPEG